MVYLISYEVNEMLYDYSSLVETIKSIGSSYQHPMRSLWFISAENTSVEDITEIIKKQFHTNTDTVFVTAISKTSHYQGWLSKVFWSWLNSNLNDR